MAQPAIFLTQCYKEAWNDLDELNTVYLITWNPKPKFYNYTPYGDNDYRLQWFTMVDVLSNAYRSLHYFAFMPEISDEGKLHMHGFFTIRDKVKYHKSFLPSLKRGGFIKKSRVNSLKWKTFKYHVKDVQDTLDHMPFMNNELLELCVNHHNCQLWRRYITEYKMLVNHIDETNKKPTKKNVMQLLKAAEALLEESN